MDYTEKLGNILTKYDKETLFREFEDYINIKYGDDIPVPLRIFSGPLSPLECLVKFLVENKGLNYSRIGSMLKKDRRVIWTTYRNSRRKEPSQLRIDRPGLEIPISKLVSDRLSISELVVTYLKNDLKLRNKEIADILNINPRTVWTFCSRAAKKKGGDQ